MRDFILLNTLNIIIFYPKVFECFFQLGTVDICTSDHTDFPKNNHQLNNCQLPNFMTTLHILIQNHK